MSKANVKLSPFVTADRWRGTNSAAVLEPIHWIGKAFQELVLRQQFNQFERLSGRLRIACANSSFSFGLSLYSLLHPVRCDDGQMPHGRMAHQPHPMRPESDVEERPKGLL